MENSSSITTRHIPTESQDIVSIDGNHVRFSHQLLARGVYTASAGNMAQGLAWHARRLGIACTAVVPETAPQAKLSAITRLEADYLVVFDLELNATLDAAKATMRFHEFVRLARVPATRGCEDGRRTETGLVLLLG